MSINVANDYPWVIAIAHPPSKTKKPVLQEERLLKIAITRA